MEFNGNGAAALQSPRFTLRQVQMLDFGLHEVGDATRTEVEAYVRRRFEAAHEARITHFLPYLLSVGHGRSHCAAVGLARATEGRLFAESYLAAPAEQAIAVATGHSVARSDILEIGNLVSTWKGSSLVLFVFLSELISRLGHRYVLFTATPEVERLLAHLGYAATVLASADPAHLPDRGAQWGRYYERGPRVMFGDVPPAVAAARRDLLYRGVARSVAAQVERVADAMQRR